MNIASYTTVKELTKLNNISLLHIGASETTFTQSIDEATNFTFNIGSLQIAREFFSCFPPTPDETERAIMLTEDSIMPFSKQIMKENQLISTDKTLIEFAALMNIHPIEDKIVLPRTDMEILFGRLSALISGRPISSDILPESTEFAARLLILREVMHHFGFNNIVIISTSM